MSLRHWIARRFTKRPRPRAASPHDTEAAEWSFYVNYLKEGMTAFDVGAYCGEVTLLFSRFVGEKGHVHAFEPCAANFERLQVVVQHTDRRNVTLNRAAVADSEGAADLRIFGEEYMSWSSLADRPLGEYGITATDVRTERVRTMAIDDYCEHAEIERVDLLKIDAEGAELQALLGARRMFEERRVGACVFEFGQTTFDMGNSPYDIKSFFDANGYRVRNVVRGDPLFPLDEKGSACFSVHVAEPRK